MRPERTVRSARRTARIQGAGGKRTAVRRIFGLVREAGMGVASRPTRTVLSGLGVAVGVGTLVATIGLGSTAAAQISSDFNALLATEVGVGVATANDTSENVMDSNPEGGGVADQASGHIAPTANVFPADASQRAARITGVVSSTLWYVVDPNMPVATSLVAESIGHARPARVVAVDENFAETQRLQITGKRDLGVGATAWLGQGLADKLGIRATHLPAQILVGNIPTTVVGIVTDSPVDLALLNSVAVSLQNATAHYGNLGRDNTSMLIRTRPGAAQLVAHLAPLAIRPDAPHALTAAAPADPTSLRNKVNSSVQQLLVELATVALIVGALGIANMTLVSVLERISEIGLRRAVGASRLAIAGQFICESGAIGLLGGIAGGCAGLVVVVAVSAAHTWTVTLPSGLPLLGPALGVLVGIAAGGYPAYRAARIQPAQALRR